MSELDVAMNLVNQHFSQIAVSYKNKNIKALISYYTESIGLLFWNDIGHPMTSHKQLVRWYEELFSQCDVVSLNFQIDKVYPCETVIVSSSQWKIILNKLENNSFSEELILRATHVFKQQSNNHWLICHLHVSPDPSDTATQHDYH